MERPARFTYFAPRDVAIPRVARQCMMRFCEALAKRGAHVRLVALGLRLEFDEPTRSRGLWDVYGIEHRFPVRILPTRLRQSSPDAAIAWRRFLRYGAHAAWSVLRGGLPRGTTTTFYFRNLRSALPLFAIRRVLPGRVRLVLEVHAPIHARHGRLVRRLDGIVCISRELATDVERRLGVDPRRVLVAHTGVNLARIERLRVTKAEARTRLGLPLHDRVVVYTGKVHRDYREMDLLIEAARKLPEDVLVLIVGGRQDQVGDLRRRVAAQGPDNVRFEGFVAPSDIHDYQFAADALVMYYPKGIAYNDYRSPAKLFEYLASGVPVVASDYRSIREVISSSNGVLVEPERPDLLASALVRVLEDPSGAAAMGEAGRRTAEGYTWDVRAERVLRFVESLPPRR